MISTTRLTCVVAVLTLVLGFAASTPIQAATANPFDVKPLGSALDKEIIDLFVPPTRSSNPFAATKKGLYAYDAKTAIWNLVYQSSSDTNQILSIEGYASSSQALYIVHQNGVSRTRDSGASWKSFTPSGFPEGSEHFVGIVVSPMDRRTVILATKDTAWVSTTFGEVWRVLSIPEGCGEITSLSFSGTNSPVLSIGTKESVYHSSDLGRGWKGTGNSNTSINHIASSTMYIASAPVTPDSVISLRDVTRLDFAATLPLGIKGGLDDLVSDYNGTGLIWIVQGSKLYRMDFQSNDKNLELIYSGNNSIDNLSAHPRNSMAIYWSSGNQVYFGEDTKGANIITPRTTITQNVYAKNALINLKTAQTVRLLDDTQSAEAILEGIMGGEPTLSRAIAAALEFANYDEKDVAKWKRNVRKRHLLPDISVTTGTRQWPSDRYGVVRNVDRFGISDYDDINRNDKISDLDRLEVEVAWSLKELMFDREQVDISEEARDRATQRNELIEKITEIYFDRIQLLVTNQLHGSSLERNEKIKLQLELVESTQLLNELCGEQIF